MYVCMYLSCICRLNVVYLCMSNLTYICIVCSDNMIIITIILIIMIYIKLLLSWLRILAHSHSQISVNSLVYCFKPAHQKYPSKYLTKPLFLSFIYLYYICMYLAKNMYVLKSVRINLWKYVCMYGYVSILMYVFYNKSINVNIALQSYYKYFWYRDFMAIIPLR